MLGIEQPNLHVPTPYLRDSSALAGAAGSGLRLHGQGEDGVAAARDLVHGGGGRHPALARLLQQGHRGLQAGHL